MSSIPNSMTKTQLYQLLHPTPIHTVRARINEIIFENRSKHPGNKSKSREQITRVWWIEAKELKEYFETYGYPAELKQET